MNEIINWIAINNTLMIRIGFTAVILLIVIYMFRFFFVPKINTVAEAESAKKTIENQNEKTKIAAPKNNVSTEEKAEVQKTVETGVESSSSEEAVALKAEIENLKKQLLQSESEVKALKAQGSSVASSAGAEVARAEVESSESDKSDSDLIASLQAKIDQLQSRLSEYEIIAEDISEIGQLRQENAELKKKLNSETKDKVATEKLVEEAQVSEPEPVIEEVAAMPQPEAPSIRLVSEKETSATEKQLVDQFEEVLNKKGS